MTAAVSNQAIAVQSFGKRSGSTSVSAAVAVDVDAGRHVEMKHFVGDLGVHDEIVELDARRLTEPVDELEPPRLLAVETDRDRREIRGLLRLELDPIERLPRERPHDLEVLAHVAVAAEQHGRARSGRVVEWRDGDFLELLVVDPELRAVG